MLLPSCQAWGNLVYRNPLGTDIHSGMLAAALFAVGKKKAPKTKKWKHHDWSWVNTRGTTGVPGGILHRQEKAGVSPRHAALICGEPQPPLAQGQTLVPGRPLVRVRVCWGEGTEGCTQVPTLGKGDGLLCPHAV